MADREVNHLDRIFHAMGDLKTFTICQILTMAIVCFPAAYQLLSNVFICRNVPHRCAPPPDNSSGMLADLEGYRHEELTVSYHQCEIVVSYNDTVLRREECVYGMHYDLPIDTSVVSQFDLVCDYSSLAGLSQTLVIAGQGFGAGVFTLISDRYGRKPVLVTSNFGLLVCGLIIAYAPNYTVFAIFKFWAGAFQQGCFATFSTFCLELLTTGKRRLNAFCCGLAWGICAMTLSLWAYVFRNNSWRTLQMALSMASIPFIFQLWYLKESLRWLIANGRTKTAMDYIRYATKVNKTSFEQTKQAYDETCLLWEAKADGHAGNTDTASKAAATRKLTLLDILKIKRMLLNTLILWLGWFTTALSFFVIYMSSTSLAGDPYLNFFLTALMEVSNNFILYVLLKRLSRKVIFNIIFIAVSIGLVVSGIFRSLEENSLNSAMVLVFSCLGMTGASGAFAFIYFYTTEMFPTNVRNQALGVSSLMGRVGGMTAPFTGILAEKAKWAPGAVIGSIGFTVCLLSVFLPETKRRELPQTIEDLKAWFYESQEEIDKTDESKITKPSIPI